MLLLFCPVFLYFALYSNSAPIPLVGLYIRMAFLKQCIPVAFPFIPMVSLSMTVGPTLDAQIWSNADTHLQTSQWAKT